ncbi:MAG: hypothetical protein ACXW3D_11560 [Caulobacteraceae bacterium]
MTAALAHNRAHVEGPFVYAGPGDVCAANDNGHARRRAAWVIADLVLILGACGLLVGLCVAYAARRWWHVALSLAAVAAAGGALAVYLALTAA